MSKNDSYMRPHAGPSLLNSTNFDDVKPLDLQHAFNTIHSHLRILPNGHGVEDAMNYLRRLADVFIFSNRLEARVAQMREIK